MGKILQWLLLVVICVYFKVDGVYGKSEPLINKHESRSVNNLQDRHKTNSGVKHPSGNSIENVTEKKQEISKKMDERTITTEEYLKSLTSTQPIMVSKHSETKRSDSSAVKSTKVKSQINKSDEETKEQIDISKKAEDKTTKEKKSEIETPDENSKDTSGSAHEVTRAKIEDNSKSPKHETVHPKNSNADNKLTETTIAKSAKHKIQKHKKFKLKSRTSKPKANRKKEKKAKKLLVKFFHTELDEDEREQGKKAHFVKENENNEQNTQTSSQKSDVQDTKGEHASKTHVVKETDHDENDSRIELPSGDKEHAEVKQEKRVHVTKENEHSDSSTRDGLPSTHTKDEESTLAEISDKLYKRTGLQAHPLVSNVNNKIIETILPSGPNAVGTQHVRLSSEPTHVMFKPVHKYYPAIHRYMTKPIHRYLKKPVDLSGITPPLEGQEFTTPQVKEYTTPPLIQNHVQIPQDVANNLVSDSGRLQNRQSPLEVKPASSLPGQQVTALLANDQPPAAPQVQNYHTGESTRPVPGGLVHGHHLLPGDISHGGTVRIFTQLPPRIQPVLLHPHRLSQTGVSIIKMILNCYTKFRGNTKYKFSVSNIGKN